VASGALDDRDGLAEALDCVRAGDTLVVWRLDRLGRSLKQLIERVTALEVRGVGFRSLTEAMDTTTSGGRLIFHVFGALAEFERAVISDRTLVVLLQPPIPAEPREGALGRPQATIHRLGITSKRWRGLRPPGPVHHPQLDAGVRGAPVAEVGAGVRTVGVDDREPGL
jgi:hypothetical protein